MGEDCVAESSSGAFYYPLTERSAKCHNKPEDLTRPEKVGCVSQSVAEHGGRVPGRREAVAVVPGEAGLVLPGGVGGSIGSGGVVGVHGLLGAVEVGLEPDAVGEVGEGGGAQHHDARSDRILPHPPTAPHPSSLLGLWLSGGLTQMTPRPGWDAAWRGRGGRVAA